jgi:signal transduction histidine kinase
MDKMTVQGVEKKPHILVIDDEEGIRRMVSILLEQLDYRVSAADSAEAAWQLLAWDQPDLILTDVMMPGEDGLSFLARVHQQLPELPVVIMTGFAQLQSAVDAIKHGAFDFMQKPFDFGYLCQVVSKAVEFSRLRCVEKQYRAQLEETVALRTDELKNAMTQLEATSALLLKAANDKREFMTTITHEMRTPMNGVIGALDVLVDGDLSGIQREFVLIARQAADNMVTLINQLLSFSALSSSGPAVCHELICLPELLKVLEHNFQPRFAKKTLFLDIVISADIPATIGCDGKQLVQLLDILLANALKFTEWGGVRLDVSLERNGDRNEEIHFCVTDSGIGIPEEMLERIFEPFIQVDGSVTRRFGGTGLGLSIARQVAQLLGGRLWAESTLGEGSRFHFIMTPGPLSDRIIPQKKKLMLQPAEQLAA